MSKIGIPINLGPAALAAKTQGAAIGDGELYYATNGTPARFYATNEKTGKIIFSAPLPTSDVVWGMTVGSDGNVYLSGTYNGLLYRYIPSEQKLEQLGENPSDNWVWQLKATSDGKIYGATYPNTKVFEYDSNTNKFTDLGSFHEGENYARGLGVTDQYLYVGIGTTAHLHQMNRETGERKEITLPITGSRTSITNIWEYGNCLFITYGTSLLIIDSKSGDVLKELNSENGHTFDGLISPPSPYDENLIYYRESGSSELWTYNLETNQNQPVEPKVVLPASSAKAIEWKKEEGGKMVLAILHHQIEYSVYNPVTNKLEINSPEVEMQPLEIQSLELLEDGCIYMGGYQGAMGVYDISKETYLVRERDPHQIEGIGYLNGNVYFGAYGGARIYKYNPVLPYRFTDGGKEDNPHLIYEIPNGQSRPFTFASGDGNLFVGTISDYGKLGGSLTIYNEETNEWKSIRHIIKDQSIIGLAYKDGVVYGGSTVAGGLGIEPVEKEAKIFSYNVRSGDSEVFDLKIKGLKTPTMIGELSFGPDNNLWGTAFGLNENGVENSVVFAMDPDTKEVLKSVELYTGTSCGSRWRPFFMRWDKRGKLYTTAARKLTVIEPETMIAKQIIDETVNLMDVDNDGNIYYASGSNLIKIPVQSSGTN